MCYFLFLVPPLFPFYLVSISSVMSHLNPSFSSQLFIPLPYRWHFISVWAWFFVFCCFIITTLWQFYYLIWSSYSKGRSCTNCLISCLHCVILLVGLGIYQRARGGRFVATLQTLLFRRVSHTPVLSFQCSLSISPRSRNPLVCCLQHRTSLLCNKCHAFTFSGPRCGYTSEAVFVFLPVWPLLSLWSRGYSPLLQLSSARLCQ